MDYNIVASNLELDDPNPDIWELFRKFDELFFENTLMKNCVELCWSPKMTLTAGLCSWNPRTSFCCIKLSLPLLQLRARRDLVETLLHEMIHGFLFVTREDDNHESHGQKFHYHMYRINQMTGTRITVYHTFHDEVRNYQNHIWKCSGPCQNRPPFFGLVKRSMNRKPGPNDPWWAQHKASCDGEFVKISEPEPNNKRKALDQPTTSKRKPTSVSSSNNSQKASSSNAVVSQPKSSPPNQKKISDYWSSIGPGKRLGNK